MPSLTSNKKVCVLIPYWVQDVLKRNSLALAECLDINKLRPIMALNDIAAFLALQKPLYLKTLANVDATDELAFIWGNSVLASNADTHEFLWTTVVPFSADKTIIDELQKRLFGENTTEVTYQSSSPFEIYDLTPEVLGVVIYPGYFNMNTNNIDLQKNLVEGIIEILYRYLSFHEVAKTPFFRGFLELLQRSQE